jgi:hypothetical protein
VQVLEPGHIIEARHAHWAALDRNEAAFRQHVGALLGLRGGSYEATALDYSRFCFEPLFSAPFRIDRAYVTELANWIGVLKKQMFAKDGSFVQLPPNMVFLNRLQFGFYSVLARLNVSVDYAACEREFLPAAG